MKLCCVASSGGHWEELMSLKGILERHECFYVTERGGQADEAEVERLYTFDQINRKERLFFFKFIRLRAQAARLMRKEQPDVVLSTGALLSFPFCLWGKMHRRKVIYIESFGRVEGKSMTGRLVYPFADFFIVQWESMLQYYPKAIYGGSVF
ncbi:MAG: polysaccharide biosynthesis protein [Bacteroidales bacterium]|nr:polysaccharide biosynthesis protein [Bacteroidales bacterium]